MQVSRVELQNKFVESISLYLADFKLHDEVSHVLLRFFLDQTFPFV